MNINVVIAIISSVILTALASFPLHEYYSKKRVRRQIAEMKENHRKEWEDLIYKLNHSGTIPKAATSLGLIGLILSAILRCINSLETLLANRDWNTGPVIIELRGIVMVELGLLHKQLGEFLDAQRNHLKDYQHKQDE